MWCIARGEGYVHWAMCLVPCAVCLVPCAVYHVPCTLCHVPSTNWHALCVMWRVPCIVLGVLGNVASPTPEDPFVSIVGETPASSLPLIMDITSLVLVIDILLNKNVCYVLYAMYRVPPPPSLTWWTSQPWWPECDVPVPGIPGTGNFHFLVVSESVLEQIGNWKKSWNRYLKKLVPERVWEPVSKKFGTGKKSGNRYQKNLTPELIFFAKL